MARAFTLFEVLIVIGILSLVGVLTLGVGTDSIFRANVGSETTLLAELLTRARNMSMNNVNESPHGVHLDSTDFVLFEGATYDANDPDNVVVPRSGNIAVTAFPDVVFEQLSGAVSGAPISTTLSDDAESRTVVINEEGRIQW